VDHRPPVLLEHQFEARILVPIRNEGGPEIRLDRSCNHERIDPDGSLDESRVPPDLVSIEANDLVLVDGDVHSPHVSITADEAEGDLSPYSKSGRVAVLSEGK
jgi:hypothetical protein